MEKRFIWQILAASIAVGLIAAIAIYSACTFAKCPAFDRTQFAIMLFVIAAGFTFLKRWALFSGTTKK